MFFVFAATSADENTGSSPIFAMQAPLTFLRVCFNMSNIFDALDPAAMSVTYDLCCTESSAIDIPQFGLEHGSGIVPSNVVEKG